MLKQVSITIAVIALTNTLNLHSLQEIKQLSELQQFMHKNFEDHKPLIIKFYATWCGACQALDPVFSQTATKFKDKAHFGAIDVDNKELQKARDLLGVKAIPTIIYVRTGYEDQKAFDERVKHFLTTPQKEAPKKAEKKKPAQKPTQKNKKTAPKAVKKAKV